MCGIRCKTLWTCQNTCCSITKTRKAKQTYNLRMIILIVFYRESSTLQLQPKRECWIKVSIRMRSEITNYKLQIIDAVYFIPPCQQFSWTNVCFEPYLILDLWFFSFSFLVRNRYQRCMLTTCFNQSKNLALLLMHLSF
jgi:hypothetical protein